MAYPDLEGKTRNDVVDLLDEWVSSESLRRHCMSVEASMRAYADKVGEDAEAWGLVGLVHDFDYERHPTLDEHPMVGASVLKGQGYPAWVIDAVLSHAEVPDVPRDTPLKKTLYAVDELSGFIAAVAFVRPSRSVADVKVSSVKKKMKDKRFAAAINREQIRSGAELLGVELDEHIANVISALQSNAGSLGLDGNA